MSETIEKTDEKVAEKAKGTPGLERNDVGLQVLYRLPDFPPGTARLRPAQVTQDFGTAKNLRVTLDLANDLDEDRPLGSCDEHGTVTSAVEGKGVGQFKANRLYMRA